MGIHEDILARITVKVSGTVLSPTFIQQYEMLPYQPGQYAKTFFYYPPTSPNPNKLEICIDVRDHRPDQGFITIEAARQTLELIELYLDNQLIATFPQLTLSEANSGAIGRVNWHIIPSVSPANTFRIGDKLKFETVTTSPTPTTNIWKVNNVTIPTATESSFIYVFTQTGTYTVEHFGNLTCSSDNQIYNCTSVSKTLTLLDQTLCTWLGSTASITIPNIFALIDAYLTFGYTGFIPTIPQIFACVDYYTGTIATAQFNTVTGCNF